MQIQAARLLATVDRLRSQAPVNATASPDSMVPSTLQSLTALDLHQSYRDVRSATLALASSLSAEDQCVQSMPDTSPTKWHLAHTAWFFETVVLLRYSPGYRPFDSSFQYLFNSYYESLGPRHARPQRGLVTRPGLDQVRAYRAHVDLGIEGLLRELDDRSSEDWNAISSAIKLGLQHEQQHQELLLTDILHAFSMNPVLPTYHDAGTAVTYPPLESPELRWLDHAGGIVEVGHAGKGFSFDNETPRHEALLHPYAIANRLVSCGDFAKFIADGGYRRPEFWLSDGWAKAQANGWQHPAYWLAPDDPRLQLLGIENDGNEWHVFDLHGVEPMHRSKPVAQLSFYEAAAYAQWAGARLPTEFEWEAAYDTPGIAQMTGKVWQWTRSSYDPYPGFAPFEGVAAEYNGKFMVGQLVLRGSSIATPVGHTRPSYRNFFPPAARWQFSGLRLAKDI